MGVPRQLTERQMKFAELLIYNEGRMSPAECALQAGYKTRPRQAASELRNPKISPLVVKYIGELRAEVQEKHGITFERHLGELAKLRDEATAKGAWSAAVNAEVARGKAAGLYIEQKIIRTGKLDDLSEEELEKRMKEIIDQYSPILEGTDVKDVKEKVKTKQKQLRLKGEAPLKNNKPQQTGLRPLNKLNTSEKVVTSNSISSSSSHKTKE